MATRQVERYELVSHLATGGMAEVYRARAFGPHGFQKSLAIKRILPRLASDEEFVARFVHEAKLAVALSHANIVHVLDFGRTDEGLYIAMEFVDGVDLASLVSLHEKGLPTAVAFHVALEVCKGLDFAHESGVVHRDVSPSNILLSVAGEVKVADFGVALAHHGDAGRSAVGRIVGKWAYMSPEQTVGDKLDARSDQFSLGIVFYELLTGTCPTRGDDREETLARIRDRPFAPPSAINSEVHEALDQIVLRCLEREPSARFSSVADVFDAVAALASELRIIPTPRATASMVKGASVVSAADPTAAEQTLGSQLATTAPNKLLPARRSFVRETRRDEIGFTIWRPTSESRAVQKPRRWTLAGFALLTSLGLTLLAWQLVGKDDKPAAARRVTTPDTDAAIAIIDAVVELDAAIESPRLIVRTTPAGAQVLAGSELLGLTPLDTKMTGIGELALELRLADHRRVQVVVQLEPGKTTQLERALEAKQKFDTIAINAKPWVNVYFRGKRVATTPVTKLRLPLGRHRLRLINPELGLKKSVLVSVPASSPYVFSLSPK